MPLVPFSPLVRDTVARFDASPPLATGRVVGLRHFHAIDEGRDDVSTGKRQFMVSVFYPAVPDETAPHARVVDILAPQQEKALELLARNAQLSPQEKNAAFARIQSLMLRAQRDLIPAIDQIYPVLVYYPGGASHRLSNAALCERLAATGYVVFALDAPRDAPVVVFPTGQLVSFLTDNDENYIWPRVADVRFLLNQLEGLNRQGDFAGLLDLSRIGMFGHSRGGYLSNICAVEDARIRAAVNMDGLLWGLWTEGTGLQKYSLPFQERARALQTPILRLKSEPESVEHAHRNFEEEVQDFGGDFISVALAGYQHSRFATTPWLNGLPEDFAKNAMQEAPPAEKVELLTGLLADFFDTYLLHHRQHLALLAASPRQGYAFFRCAGLGNS